MKKQLSMFGFSVLIVAAVAFTAFDQQEKNKNPKKEQPQDQGKGKEKGKDNKDKNDVNNNKGNNDEKGNKGKNDGNANNDNKVKIYDWNRETFKERQKVKNQEKVTLCHKFSSGANPVTIRVSSNAMQAHMNHGDVVGNCPAGVDKRYSDDYLLRRNDYYSYLQESQEKVYYSQSIYDYAVARLNDARLQLTVYQNSNMPRAEIDRRQVIVVELEQNVGVLERLINAAANLLINKLQ